MYAVSVENDCYRILYNTNRDYKRYKMPDCEGDISVAVIDRIHEICELSGVIDRDLSELNERITHDLELLGRACGGLSSTDEPQVVGITEVLTIGEALQFMSVCGDMTLEELSSNLGYKSDKTLAQMVKNGQEPCFANLHEIARLCGFEVHLVGRGCDVIISPAKNVKRRGWPVD